MGPLVDWIELLKEGWPAVEGLVGARLADPASLTVLLLYPLATLWLAYRWGERSRRRGRVRSPDGFVVGILRLLGIVATLGIGVLIAVARTTGRSTFHSGARF